MKSMPLILRRDAILAACLALWMTWPTAAQQKARPVPPAAQQAPAQPAEPRRVTPVPATGTGRRLALLIGNKDYARKPLVNPVNDATDLAATLRSLGFEATLATNLNRVELERSVRDFAGRIEPGDVALFYFSGHGMEVEGQNYLLPVDFDAQAELEVRYQALPASLVQEHLQSHGARVAILVLDACRDNPYRSWRGGQSGGLAGMSGSGVYVAFAAAPGKTAEDNPRERNGRFTKSLLAVVRQPGLGIDDVFNEVRRQVAAESGGAQVPFSNSGLIGGFAFQEAAAPPSPVERTAAPDVEAEYWAVCKQRGGEFCQAYLDTFPQGAYARLAKAMLEPRREAAAAPTAVAKDEPAVGRPSVASPPSALDGKWICESRYNNKVLETVRLDIEGDKLTGVWSYAGSYRFKDSEAPVSDGAVNSDRVSFVFAVKQGLFGRTWEYSGSVSNGEMRLTKSPSDVRKARKMTKEELVVFSDSLVGKRATW